MGEFSIIHWLVVLIVVLIIFGPQKLPEIGRALGESIREFKKSFKEVSIIEKTTGSPKDGNRPN